MLACPESAPPHEIYTEWISVPIFNNKKVRGASVCAGFILSMHGFTLLINDSLWPTEVYQNVSEWKVIQQLKEMTEHHCAAAGRLICQILIVMVRALQK